MNKLRQHKMSMHSDFGIHLRRVNSSQIQNAYKTSDHQDDYYMFGFVENGRVCSTIDFRELYFAPGDVVLIQPGQVHRYFSLDNAECWVLFIDSCFVDIAEKCIFDKFSLFASSLQMDELRRKELTLIASLLADRMDDITDKQAKTTVICMAKALVSIVAEAVQEVNQQQTRHSSRRMEIVLSFRHLLDKHIAANRQPSYYASLLNISTVYLNEVVKAITGMNSTLYIKNELVLRAKRLLVHTNLTVKEISNRLGLDDYAYFSRLFAHVTGISPTMFRERNLG